MHETVTLQFGSKSNHVGAHFFNLESLRLSQINHDTMSSNHTMFNHSRRSRTPRVVCFDKHGSSCVSRECNVDIPTSSWAGGTSVYNQENDTSTQSVLTLQQHRAEQSTIKSKENPEKSSCDFDMSGSVKQWSDYLETTMCQQSIFDAEGIHSRTPFEEFSSGQTFASGETKEFMLDRVRYFVEQCDTLQGFHCLIDIDDAFGGVASAVLNDIADDYASREVAAFTISEQHHNNTTRLNECLAFSSLYDSCSIVIPLTLPHSFNGLLQYDSQQIYHSSAPLALALHAATLPYRVGYSSSSLSFRNMVNTICPRPKLKMASLSTAFVDNTSFLQQFKKPVHPAALYNSDSFTLLTPIPSIANVGLPALFGGLTLVEGCVSLENSANNTSAMQQSFQHFLKMSTCASNRANIWSQDPLSLPVSFPRFFNSQLSRAASGRVTIDKGCGHLGVISHLSSSSALSSIVEEHERWGKRCLSQRSQLEHLLSIGFELEEFQHIVNNLSDIRADFESASDAAK